MPKVTVIPATKPLLGKTPAGTKARRRVAGYARVSTDSDEQFTSYEAQVDYYTQYIKSHSDWEFVKVYTDEGISGLNTKGREGFNCMVNDALAGKIDLIVTKSVSRFARNTVDSLVTIRKLKDAGCECYFEKENIYTFDGKGELLITIMSSLAQEESRSISENVTWGQRKRFADGKVSMPYKHFLGYEKGPDGTPKVVAEEAETVHHIYDLFMLGLTACGIANRLTEEGIPSPAGGEKWHPSTVESILTNEKYKGDAKLQKRYTVDFLSKKMKVNEGEVPQYYVEHSHEAIISPQLFDQVQQEMARRKRLGVRYRSGSLFSGRIICGDCGGYYGPKVWNSTDKYRRVVWQCNGKYKGDHICATPHLTEDLIREKFIEAFNRLIPDREQILQDCRVIQDTLTNCAELDTEIEAAKQEVQVIVKLVESCVTENSTTALDQAAYLARYNSLVERYDTAKASLESLEKRRTERLKKAEALGGFMFALSEREAPIETFTVGLWIDSADTATVSPDGSITFRFLNGNEVTV